MHRVIDIHAKRHSFHDAFAAEWNRGGTRMGQVPEQWEAILDCWLMSGINQNDLLGLVRKVAANRPSSVPNYAWFLLCEYINDINNYDNEWVNL